MDTGNRERGQILVLVALAMVVLIAMVGLVIDGGMAWEKRREAQNAADMAALAGTRVVAQSVGGAARTNQDVYNAISAIATANNGATVPGLGTATGALYVDSKGAPISGSYVTNAASAIPATARGVKVPTSRSWTPFFLGLVGISNWSASADATARTTVGASPVCVFCVIGTSPTFKMQDAATSLVVNGGAIGSNSGLNCQANSTLTSAGVGLGMGIFGTYSPGNCAVTPARTALSSAIPDPLAFLADPTATGTNFGPATDKGPNTTTNLSPGIYSSLSIQANATVHLNPGTYYFTGDVQVESSSLLTGTDVTLVFMNNASFKPKSGTANVQLSAPLPTNLSATYPGLLMYFDRRGTHTIQTQASSTSTLQGTIYGAPNPSDPMHTGTFLDMESGSDAAAMNGLVIVTSASLKSSKMNVTYNGNQNVQLPGGPAGLVQ